MNIMIIFRLLPPTTDLDTVDVKAGFLSAHVLRTV
ncbi:MAG: hypothetical protein LMBGKNDO_00380 [Bacteroidales bacterium]|jgi:hypothetical protein|nr:hypothetical protein [Bacteroidales bacterium]